MQSGKNWIRPRPIQALDQFFSLTFAIKPELGKITLCRDRWQLPKSKNQLSLQQQVKTQFETQVGGPI